MQNILPGIRLLCADVDGSLCGPLLSYGQAADAAAAGHEVTKSFHVRDGHRMVYARSQGLQIGLCSGRDSAPLRLRAQDLGLDPLLLGVRDKPAAMAEVLQQRGLEWSQVAFLGDDYPDLPLIGKVACFFAPADAAPAIRRRADAVTLAASDGGAFAEVIETILRSQGTWPPQGL